MELQQVIRTRRSARQFLPKPIPEAVIEDILDAGRLAPSPGNAQNFLFGVVRDPATKVALATAAGGQEWIADAPVVIAHCARLAADLADLPHGEYAKVVSIARFGAELVAYLNDYPDRRAMRVFWENGTPLIPGEHVFLTAVSHGLRACWIGHLDVLEASRILKLPQDVVCLYLMPIGYPTVSPGPRPTRQLSECVFYEQWTDSPVAVPASEG